MAPTLSPGAHERGQFDRVMIRRGYGTIHQLSRGDIVTFWKPHKPEEISIKRVVALEGDLVYPKRGYVVDGSIEPGTKRLGLLDGIEPGQEGQGVVVVPRGHVWVEGDNWRKSYDSNDFGPISRSLIEGKATRVWKGWFGWWKNIEDGRQKGKGSRVIEGQRLSPGFAID